MAKVKKQYEITDGFEPGFEEAFAMVVIEFGRLEQQIQLAYKSLHGGGLEAGMGAALKISQKEGFSGLCKATRKLAEEKLANPDELATFKKQMRAARTIGGKRNDHVHASWTSSPDDKAHRYRVVPDEATGNANWQPHSRVVPIDELRTLATEARKLMEQVHDLRFSWKLKP